MLKTKPILDLCSPLEKIQTHLQEDLDRVNHLIIHKLSNKVPLINQVAKHLIGSGGKRLRPMLTLLCARLCGYTLGQRHINLATCVEFIHTATLLHDDVIDKSDQRRGSPSANALWGNEASILVGDFLFSRAFELMVSDDSSRVLEILSAAASAIAEGEVLQLTTTGDLNTSESAYFQIVQDKTASLFSAACEIGGVVSQKEAPICKALADYGQHFGVLFQLMDDVLDYGINAHNLGKNLGNDLKERKMTLPLILLYQQGSLEEKKTLETLLKQPEISEQDLTFVTHLLVDHSIPLLIKDYAIEFAQKAKASLEVFSSSFEKDLLEELVEFCLCRPR